MEGFLTIISEYFVQSAAAILFLPLWVIVMIFVNAAIPFLASKKMTLNLTLGASLISIVFAVFCIFYCLKTPQTLAENNITWLSAEFQVSFGVIIDNLSSVMLLVVSAISFLVQLYSYGYLKEDKSFHRYFIYLNLAAFSIYGLILASNAVQTYIFWELTGVASYLLIGFWYQKRSAANAAQKAFVLNKLGDICLLLGVIALVYFSVVFNPVQNVVLLSYSTLQFTAETLYSMVSGNAFLVISILIFAGAMLKSAQFPFQSWIADSAEAPAPAIALISPVIMALSGVYLCARFYPIFILSKTAMCVITAAGAVTALICAYIAMSQNDLRKLLAYCASSQIGLIFAGFGAGAFSGAMFHLCVYGVSQALLVLSAGTVVTALKNEADIRYAGGLRKQLPLSAFAFFVGSACICGILFSGFYSLDSIFTGIFEYGNEFLITAIVLTVFLTAFCLFRAYFLVFEGKNRFDYSPEKIHWTMNIPLVVLSLAVISGGCLLRNSFAKFIYFISPEKMQHVYAVQIVIMLFAALCAIYIAYNLYVWKNNVFVMLKERTLKKSNLPYKLSYNGLYTATAGKWLVESVFLRLCRLLDFVEKYIIDGFVVVVALTTRVFSYMFSKSQNGNVQSYLTYSVFILGAVMLVTALIYILGSLMGV